MNLLNKLLDKKYFNPKILPKLNNENKNFYEYAHNNYKRIIDSLEFSYKDNIIFNNHFIEYTAFIHPDTNKSFLLFATHYYPSNDKKNIIKNRYIYKFLNYDNDQINEFIENQKNFNYKKFIKLKKGEFNLILQILCNKLMICGDYMWSNSFYSIEECPFCLHKIEKKLFITTLQQINKNNTNLENILSFNDNLDSSYIPIDNKSNVTKNKY
jgi:hypothetical protein